MTTAGVGERFGNYRLVRRIAFGGMAEIWLAHEEGAPAGAPPVVVKRLHRHLSDDEIFLRMFLDEARIAARLDHPGIARILSLGEEDGELYLAMEYVPGPHLRAIQQAAARRNRRLSPELVARLLSELCAALDYAHERTDRDGSPLGIVHRDVTPTNVMVSERGEVKLLDFGIAKAADQRERTQAGILKGKFRYMAPEQARGRAVDRRTDVFAVAVMLYELTVGHGPFERSDDIAVLRAVTLEEPPAPTKVRPGFPAGLEAVILKGLSKDPARRFPTARALRAELERWLAGAARPVGSAEIRGQLRELGLLSDEAAQTALEELPELTATEAGGRSSPGRRGPPPFVGRTRELAQLLEAGERARKRPEVLLLLGPDGSGRTRLLHEAAEILRGRGFTVLRAAGKRRGGACNLLEQLLRGATSTELASPGEAAARLSAEAHSLLGDERGTQVAALTGQLIGFPFDQHPAVRLFQGDDRLFQKRALASVRLLLAAMAARAPLLLLVDGADEAEAGALALLQELLGGVADAPLLLLVAGSWSLRSGAEPAFPDAQTLELKPLRSTALAELLEGIGAPPADAAAAAERAEGNPLCALELHRLILCGVPASALPSGLAAAMRERVAHLPTPEREALARASVLGGPLRRGDVAEVSGPEVVAALEGLVEGGILELTSPGAYRFAREGWRAVAGSAVPEREQQALHRLAATRALSRGEGRDLAAAADHWEQAGEIEKAATALLAAGDLARDRFDSRAAAKEYEQALGAARSPALRFRLASRLEEAFNALADRVRQREVIEGMAALAAGLSPVEQAEVSLRRLLLAQRLGNSQEVLEKASEVIAAKAESGDPVGQGAALGALGSAMIQAGYAEAATKVVVRALRLGRKSGDATGVARAMSQAGNLRMMRGDYPGAARTYQRAIDLASRQGEARLAANWLGHLSEAHLLLGDIERALPLREQSLELMRSLGHRWGEAFQLMNLANSYRRAGRPGDGIAVARESLILLGETQDRFHGAFARAYLGLCHLERGESGDLESARAAAFHAIELARETDNATAEVEGLCAAAIAELHLGELAQAVKLSGRAHELLRARGPLQEFEAETLYYHHVVMARAGNEREASRSLDAAYARIKASAGRIRDPWARDRFLGKVPINRAIVSAYRRGRAG